MSYDYIIAGGGLSGCVLASRLSTALPNLKIALIETGPDSQRNEAIASPGNAWMITPDYYHNYETLPQKHLDNRNVAIKTGRALGGGSAVNYGGWTRGDRSGYDEWARVVGDSRWSYDELLPYFKRAETYPLPNLEDQHGYEGPIKPSRGDRGYLLKEDVLEAMKSTGLQENPDANGGDIRGVARLVESWDEGRRTFAAGDYDLGNVEVLAGMSVQKVVVEGGVAKGVVLGDGRVLEARREVVVSCGALRTPQVLMLSGIGPRKELEKLGIEVLVDSPHVGKNLHDHGMVAFWYKLRHPEQGLAIGSEKFMANPRNLEGNPMDWMINTGISDAETKKAAEIDGKDTSRRDDIEITCIYLAAPTSPFPPPPMDGTHISVSVIGIHATSRGSVSLSSTDPNDLPLIDPAYLATEHDRAVIRTGAKIVAKMMESPAGQRISTGETPPGPFSPLTSKTSDAEIDERARACIFTAYHPAGSAAMGTVVDAECRVKGMKGLRVVDASIMPVSIGAHLQASLYGVAERAAQMIIDAAK
ncbi:hypothetical protein PRZ48_010402 [Zasmidium cellare]|uniref:Glucose-methanol-choline oxidoreductase N-terminal domain-containing protein n=1 Tax=Zasmidium cellare TaxID=395010 RepID=A0ABR0E8I8_ZASCE|nr:hypothetical protein PRZ48_010402 [Zasmidium cellare]